VDVRGLCAAATNTPNSAATSRSANFDPGLYVNPGPWRIPYHHHGMLDYARRLKVPLEAFNQVNFNAYLHSSKDFGGKPQRYRHIYADYHGHIAELLSKAVNKGQLDAELTTEDKERLLESLRIFGVLDKDYRYTKSFATSESRGYDIERGAGLMPPPQFSTPIARDALLKSGLANYMVTPFDYDLTPSMFQPVGGMDRIAMALYNDVAALVELDAKVTAIDQDERGVSVTYVDARRGGEPKHARADWCLCTIPLSILSEIPVKVGEAMSSAIQAAPYEASVKFGLQFKRRFWEEDERIYGGISFTDLPIQMIGYPMAGMNQAAKACCSAATCGARTPTNSIR
jgi:monoamine oxidase